MRAFLFKMNKIIGKKIIRYKEIDSTNDEAKRLIKRGLGEGTLIVSGSQTKGKGKPGSAWFSPAEVGAYLSAILRPFKNPKDIASITILGARAVVTAVEKLSGLKAEIKLPNDLILHGKKLGGILVERMASGHLIIGMGVNVNNRAGSFPPEIRKTATSLKIESGRDFDLEEFLNRLISELNKEYLAYLVKI
ncbi:MAG: biotin--[acetyl-CoA-carboxylase] ligase [Candidatus Margulisiibacteriota bacterium]